NATASSGQTVFFSVVSGPVSVNSNLVSINGAGTVTIRASQPGGTNYNPADPVDQSFTIAKVTPTITWNNPGDITYGAALGFAQLNAFANMQGSFVYDPPAGTVLDAGTHTLSVTFTPNDTTNYNTATKSVSITVFKTTPFINWSYPADIIYG